MNEMAWTFLGYVSAAVLLLTLYAFLLQRLARIVHPYRLKMAEMGESLLASDVAPNEENRVKFYLDNAFSPYPMVGFALFFLPFGLVSLGFFLLNRKKITPPSREMDKISALFTLSAFAANPLFGTVALLEAAVLGLVVVLIAEPGIIVRTALSLFSAEAHPWKIGRVRFS